MYHSAEAPPEPGQTSKINLFVGIVNVFGLTLLTTFDEGVFFFYLF